MRHGTRYAWFKGGCRCDECAEGRRAADRARRRRRQERAAADPSIIPHGKNGYADWGCRCDICAGEHRRQNRERLGFQPAKTWTEEQQELAVHLFATKGLKAAMEAVDASIGPIHRWAAERGVTCYEPPPVHGRSRYQRSGCRCEVCVAAYYADTAAQKAKRAANQDRAPHGTASGYTNWRCRCDPCKAAGARQNAETWRRRKEREAATSG
jgi:hypothetical protein